jgi:hypothetical protein
MEKIKTAKEMIIKEAEANNDDFWLFCTVALFALTGTVLTFTQIYKWILIANDFAISNALSSSLKWLGIIVSLLGVCVAIGFLVNDKAFQPTEEGRENRLFLLFAIILFVLIKFILYVVARFQKHHKKEKNLKSEPGLWKHLGLKRMLI